ncbi:MAG: exopolysaccharide biosynthesis protein [Chlamydiales bacterium]
MRHRLSEEFHYLAHYCIGKELTLKELADHIGSRAQALITLFLSVPFVLFIPLPGLSIVFGIFIFINGIRIATKKRLWFPRLLLKRRIHGARLSKCFHGAERIVKRLEKFTRPRGHFLIRHPRLQILHGIMLATCGFLLALPLPPGTNFPPGLTALFLSIGILEEDGLFIILGYLFFMLTLGFFILLPIFGIQELHEMFNK